MTNAEYIKALRLRAVAEGKCYQCRCRPQKPGARYCVECMERNRTRERANYYKRCINCRCNLQSTWRRLLCPGCSHERNERTREERQKLKASGICSHCGKQPAAPRRLQCLACLEDTRLRALVRNRMNGAKPKRGSCSTCTAQGLPGLNHTKHTHDRYMAAAEKWRAA